jgi:hypothetical protein
MPINRQIAVEELDFGVWVTGPTADGKFITTLIREIHEHLETELRGKWGPEYTGVKILVGVKPVEGLSMREHRK